MVDTKLRMFVPISKVDEEQRMVYGIATTSALDKQNEIVDWGATKKALTEYSQWRNIREMHKPSAVGVAPIIEAREEKQEVYIGAKIIDEQAWQKCKEGVYKGFSIGGEVLDRTVEFNKASGKSINRVTNYILNEISVVDRPANPLCRFETVKRDTSIETITITEDPLISESARMMEKAVGLAKRTLSKVELENLPDDKFGLIKVVSDGEKLIKHRQYPMPDRTHAVQMVKKMTYATDLSSEERNKIHSAAVLVLGKKHSEGECTYCVKQKLEGGVGVENKGVVKAFEPFKAKEEEKVVPPVEDVGVQVTKPVAPPSPEVKVDEEAPIAAAKEASPIELLGATLARIEAMLTNLLGEEKAEAEAEAGEIDECVDMEETPTVDSKTVEEVASEEAVKVPAPAPAKEAFPPQKEVLPPKKPNPFEVAKSLPKTGMVEKMRAIMEPMVKENKALRARLEKLEKAPLPRKGAVGTEKVKLEKFEAPKEAKQDMTIEKREMSFSEVLQKDITKASELRKSGRVLTADESSFCQRVAEKMLEEKLTKVA